MMSMLSRIAIGASTAALVLAAVVAPVTAVGAAPPACGNADLKASYKATDAAMSHRYGKIVLKNISGHRCTLAGYGGVSYVGGGNGTQVGAPADRVPGNEDTVVLQPGDKAKSTISETVAGVYSHERVQADRRRRLPRLRAERHRLAVHPAPHHRLQELRRAPDESPALPLTEPPSQAVRRASGRSRARRGRGRRTPSTSGR